jgi:ZIP family zinc transporter
MFQSVVDYFTSIDPILAALYASLFTWFLTALGASFVFMFKSMNRVVLDGMLVYRRCNGSSQFLSLLAPARNDRWRRFC